MIIWLVSMNYFCHLIDVTPVWKMSSMISGHCTITLCLFLSQSHLCHKLAGFPVFYYSKSFLFNCFFWSVIYFFLFLNLYFIAVFRCVFVCLLLSFLWTYLSLSMFSGIHVCLHTHIHVHMHIGIHAHACARAHTHTHTHTHTHMDGCDGF